MNKLYAEDTAGFKNFMRVDPHMFHELLDRLGPCITKKDTLCLKPFEPGLNLAITLCYLATGNSYKSLIYGFYVASNTISIILCEVCEAIIEKYDKKIMSPPTTSKE